MSTSTRIYKDFPFLKDKKVPNTFSKKIIDEKKPVSSYKNDDDDELINKDYGYNDELKITKKTKKTSNSGGTKKRRKNRRKSQKRKSRR